MLRFSAISLFLFEKVKNFDLWKEKPLVDHQHLERTSGQFFVNFAKTVESVIIV
ncbi:hypothetical protein [Haemophilus paracuniculus]|uniref:hypothetical protein n=1 Tax=Haemophilus paracuniculus TaxID=734 RepID=UPI001474135D|nr:hypothetical protein [Haemophilus paracuniculus]